MEDEGTPHYMGPWQYNAIHPHPPSLLLMGMPIKPCAFYNQQHIHNG